MSYYLIDTTKNTDNFNHENIIIDNKLDINTETSKYLIYYNDTKQFCSGLETMLNSCLISSGYSKDSNSLNVYKYI